MKTFSELVIGGPFILVKGFLMGFWSSREPQPRYFFHRKAGIRRETLRDVLVELFELENLVHLCLEDDVVPAFQEAIDRAHDVIGISVRSVKGISGAEFEFSFEIFSRDLADACRSALAEIPEGVDLIGFAPEEEVHEDEAKDGLSRYAPVHAYAYRGKGRVKGDFGGVVDLLLRVKRCRASQFILTGEIELDLQG